MELAIAVSLTAIIIIGGLRYWDRQLQLDQARRVGQAYKTINAAVGTYMTNYYGQLVTLDSACSNVQMSAPGSTPAPLPASCAMTVQQLDSNATPIGAAQTIANGLQPTMPELVALGILAPMSDVPDLPHRSNVILDATTGIAAFRFAIAIDHACIVVNTAPPPGTPPCTPDTKDLRSVVFNTNPYFVQNNDDAVARMGVVMAEIGNDAAASTPFTAPGTLGGNKAAFAIANPIAGGPERIVGVRNGYGSSGWMQFTRRDGSSPPTADWDFSGKTIRNVNIDAKNLNSDLITANTINTNVLNTKNLIIPTKAIGTPCSAAGENVAKSADGASLLVCTAGTWQSTTGKGALILGDYVDLTARMGWCDSMHSLGEVGTYQNGARTAYDYIDSSTGAWTWVGGIGFSGYCDSTNEWVGTNLSASEWLPTILSMEQGKWDNNAQRYKIEVQADNTWIVRVSTDDKDLDPILNVRFYRVQK